MLYIGGYVLFMITIQQSLKTLKMTKKISQRMPNVVKKSNYIKQIAEKNSWARKKAIRTKLINTDLQNFQYLTSDDFRQLTLEINQFKQCKSYTQEHLNKKKHSLF